MDFPDKAAEALQILNLSPIPEISEVELTSVLEQLSGLSELTGELTDRNVEDIIREAEELLEMSSSNKISSNNSKQDSSIGEKNDSINGIEERRLNSSIEAAEKKTVQTETKTEAQASPVSSIKSPKEPLSARLVSPTDSTNHIKLTLDSLREFSEKIEKQKKGDQISDNNVKEDETAKGETSPTKSDDKKTRKQNLVESNLVESKRKSSVTVQRPNLIRVPLKLSSASSVTVSRNTVAPKNKPGESKSTVKYPIPKRFSNEKRLSINNCKSTIHSFATDSCKWKAAKKVNKSPTVKKTSNELKREPLHSSLQCKVIAKRNLAFTNTAVHKKEVFSHRKENISQLQTKDDINEFNIEGCLELLDQETKNQSTYVSNVPDYTYPKIAEQILQHSKESVSVLKKELAELKSQIATEKNSNRSSWVNNGSSNLWAQDDVIKILKEENSKLFREIDEIKGELKNSARTEKSEEHVFKILKEKQDLIEILRSEVESLRHHVNTKSSEGPGIARLEEQFMLIKGKYEEQISKLEFENSKLKRASFQPEQNSNPESITDEPTKDTSDFKPAKSLQEATISEQVSKPLSARSECRLIPSLTRSTSLDTFPPPKPRNTQTIDLSRKEVSSQTEPKSRMFSASSEKLEIIDLEIPLDLAPTKRENSILRNENKENVFGKFRKPVKSKSVCDFNLDQALNVFKQKKVHSEHETQLMATLRGLNSEISIKDKEIKKQKNEIETLRNQLKKYTVSSNKRKVSAPKKLHVGTQTIGLGPAQTAEYKAVMFQVSRELEDENEQLKTSLQALEESYNQLKTKRISDLQILQEIHEEEMAKLASKLETQTALAKHLHSLLVNR